MIRTLILLCAILISIAAPALAKTGCADHEALTRALAEEQGERLVHSGLVSTGRAIIEVWLNDETGDWTALLIDARGRACVLATGGYWQDWQAPPPGAPT